MNKTVFLCAGGDARQIYMSRFLSSYGTVYTYGIESSDNRTIKLDELSAMSEKADILVLPLMKCKELEFTAYDGTKISLEKLVPHLKKNAVVTGGLLSTKQIEFFSSLGFDVTDYFKREEVVIKNCIPTAEGALQLAMQEMACTIYKSRVLIIGYGRVGKACGNLFKAVGAETFCTARRISALAEAENNGISAFHLNEFYGHIGSFDLIINTVPSLILDKALLKAVAKDTLIIDLASMPGGVDFESASLMNKKVLHALSLPGKVAPVTSGEIIAQAVKNILTERGG
ncbi:MAG: dipicolinate synthase subunit DpsA [Ruminococcus sp.]|nr:dipicolinate synthase subunit DpsA [Ruminococcus sp.]